MSQAAVFLDRDGVINKAVVIDGKPYPPKDADSFELLDGVVEGTRALRIAGYLTIVVTNQPDIARKIQTQKEVDRIHEKLKEYVELDDIYVCPHDSIEECHCRKPKAGMLTDASKKHDIDLSRSFLVGDRWRDVDCGKMAGVKTIFIDYQYAEDLRALPDATVGSVREAIDLILDWENQHADD